MHAKNWIGAQLKASCNQHPPPHPHQHVHSTPVSLNGGKHQGGLCLPTISVLLAFSCGYFRSGSRAEHWRRTPSPSSMTKEASMACYACGRQCWTGPGHLRAAAWGNVFNWPRCWAALATRQQWLKTITQVFATPQVNYFQTLPWPASFVQTHPSLLLWSPYAVGVAAFQFHFWP